MVRVAVVEPMTAVATGAPACAQQQQQRAVPLLSRKLLGMVDQRNTSKLYVVQSKGEFTTLYLKHAFPVVGKQYKQHLPWFGIAFNLLVWDTLNGANNIFPGLGLLTISLCGIRYYYLLVWDTGNTFPLCGTFY
ncbi:hypothetical protein Hanom_Chr03g00193851 [Helianthus anomalus]